MVRVVDAAYRPYIERIGTTPGPMTCDYRALVRSADVTVAERNGVVVGAIVLRVTGEDFLIDNVAVEPGVQVTGVGRALLQFAEATARRERFMSIYLYTHERMTANLALHSRIGYVEYDRRRHGDAVLVYLRKPLA